MKKEIFYGNVQKIVYSFPLNEVIAALCREWNIRGGKISGESVDDEGTIEITQVSEERKEAP